MEEWNETYVSPEVSELLAKHGFDWVCTAYYDGADESIYQHAPCKNSDLMFGLTLPTHQMAIAWFRKKYGLIILPNYAFPTDIESFPSNPKWSYRIVSAKDTSIYSYSKNFDEPEAAIEDAFYTCFLWIEAIEKSENEKKTETVFEEPVSNNG